MDVCKSHDAVKAKGVGVSPFEKVVVPISSSLCDIYESEANPEISEWLSQNRTSIGRGISGCTLTLNYETDDDNLVSVCSDSLIVQNGD